MQMHEQQRIEVDGATIEVSRGGTGQPVVCSAHPFYAEPTEGGILSDPLRGMGTVIVVTPRGLGGSSPIQSPRELTMDQLVEDLEAVRQRLGVEHWIFAGPSAGGALGLRYTVRFPQALAGLILTGTAASWPKVLDDPQSVFS